MSTIDAASQIQIQAFESARELLAQGWTAAPESYDIGAFLGDDEALADRLGREPTKDERLELEHEIREQLVELLTAERTPEAS